MKIGIVGQKWLAAELLRQMTWTIEVAYVAAPNTADRLAREAARLSIHTVQTDEAGWADHLPPVDLLIAAHAHVRVPDDLLARNAMNIGFHPSLLPLFKGRNAIADTIKAGQLVTGGTVYHLTSDLDGGPAIFQDWCFVESGDDAAELWRRSLGPMGLDLLTKAVGHAEAFGFL